jgi:hypothetical protein
LKCIHLRENEMEPWNGDFQISKCGGNTENGFQVKSTYMIAFQPLGGQTMISRRRLHSNLLDLDLQHPFFPLESGLVKVYNSNNWRLQSGIFFFVWGNFLAQFPEELEPGLVDPFRQERVGLTTRLSGFNSAGSWTRKLPKTKEPLRKHPQ